MRNRLNNVEFRFSEIVLYGKWKSNEDWKKKHTQRNKLHFQALLFRHK